MSQVSDVRIEKDIPAATLYDEPISDSVTLLRQYKEVNLTESEAKAIFDQYDLDKDEVWEREDTRAFFMDVLEVFDSYRVVTDEALDSIISEMQLNLARDGRVKWTEFRSFVLYLESFPLKHIQQRLIKSFSSDNATKSIIITGLAPNTRSSDLLTAFQDTGSIASLWLVGTVDTSSYNVAPPQALVVFEEAGMVTSAVNSLNGKSILSSNVIVTPYSFQDFPLLGGKEERPSVIARGLAKAISTAHGFKQSWLSFDERHGVTESLKTMPQRMGQRLTEFDERHGVRKNISATAKSAGAKISAGATALRSKASGTATDVRVQSAETAHTVKVKASHAAENVQVKAGDVAERVEDKLSGTGAETGPSTMEMLKGKSMEYLGKVKTAVSSAVQSLQGPSHEDEVQQKLDRMGLEAQGVGTQYKEVETVKVGERVLIPQGIGSQFKETEVAQHDRVLIPQGVGTQYKEVEKSEHTKDERSSSSDILPREEIRP